MTITSTPSEVSYAGNGVSNVFPIPFVFDTSADLKVIETDSNGNPVVVSTGFSIGGGSGSTGTLTRLLALPTGTTLTILDNPAITQDADYTDNDAFPASTHEGALDHGVRISKRLNQLLQKCLRVDDGDPSAGSGTLIGSVQARKGKYLFFNALTGAIEFAAAIAQTVLSQSIIASLLYPQSSAESSAGSTPTAMQYSFGVDVRRYGAATSASAAVNTAAIQAAINANNNVYIPAGTFSVDTLTLRAGVRIYGEGAASILSQNTITDGSYGTLYANSGSSGSQVGDIIIENLQVLGNVAGLGFSQFQHLISLNGVVRATIRGCLLKGFRGDAIYIGSGVNASDERHNTAVKILGNVIDGVNNDNRNGVSVIDGDDVLVEGNTFINCTRSNMPGAVDIEPDAYVFHRVRNIRVVRNHFDNCGGNVACISLVLGSTVFTSQPETFIFDDNTYAVGSRGLAINNSVSSYARPFNISFRGNSGRVSDPWTMTSYVNGIDISGNRLSFTGDPQLGENVADIATKVIVSNNIMTGDGVTTGLVIRSGNAIQVDNNVWDALDGYSVLVGGVGATLNELAITNNSTTAGVKHGVEFGGGTVTNVRILDNDFSRVSGNALNGSIPADTRIRNNKGYVSENGGVTTAIATGTTVTHGCGATPQHVDVTPIDSGTTNVYVSAIGGSTFTVNFGGGGSARFTWEAKTVNYFAQ